MQRGLATLVFACSALFSQGAKTEPRFEDFKVPEIFSGRLAAPIIRTADQRLYQTRIRDGVLKGQGVWTGRFDGQPPKPGPNFAGRLIVIRWSCGSDCLMMAIVDATTGEVFGSPLTGDVSSLYVSRDPMSDRDIDFRLDSSLMVLRNGCAYGRSECGVYYFNWTGKRFVLLTRTLIDLAADLK